MVKEYGKRFWRKNFSKTLEYYQKNKKEFVNKYQEIPVLILPSDQRDRRDNNYLDDIKFNYENAVYLYFLGCGLEYGTLDHCRKIIELAIRYSLNISREESLGGIRSLCLHDLKWRNADKKEAYHIYEYCCKSVHGSHVPTYKTVKRERISNDKKKILQELLKKPEKEIVKIDKQIQDIENIDKSTIEVLKAITGILKRNLKRIKSKPKQKKQRNKKAKPKKRNSK